MTTNLGTALHGFYMKQLVTGLGKAFEDRKSPQEVAAELVSQYGERMVRFVTETYTAEYVAQHAARVCSTHPLTTEEGKAWLTQLKALLEPKEEPKP